MGAREEVDLRVGEHHVVGARREGGIDEHGNRKMKLTFWAPFAIAFDVVFTLLVLYLLYKAVRWALGRGGGAAPAAEAKGGKAKAKAQ